MTLDLQTLYVIAALGLLVAGVAQLIPWFVDRSERSAVTWASGHLVMGFANVAVVAHGAFPAFRPGIAPGVAHIAAYALILHGVRSFDDPGRRIGPVLAAALICVVPMIVAASAVDASFRNGYMNLVRAGWDLSVAVTAVRIARRDRLSTGWIAAFLFGATIPLFLGRVWLAAQGQLRETTLGAQHGPAIWLAAGAISFVIFRGFCLPQMSAEAGRKALAERARRDPLTGAYNRSGLLEMEAPRRGTTAVVMIDLDRFKMLNDIEGHAAGDRALRLVATIAAAVVGERGSVVRMGGDEFLCVLPGVAADAAAAIADRIEQRYVDEIGSITTHDLPLSLSTGIACGDARGGMAALLAAADAAMYRVKSTRAGRRATDRSRPHDPPDDRRPAAAENGPMAETWSRTCPVARTGFRPLPVNSRRVPERARSD